MIIANLFQHLKSSAVEDVDNNLLIFASTQFLFFSSVNAEAEKANQIENAN